METSQHLEKSASTRIVTITMGHFLVDFYMNLIPAILPFLAIELKLSLTSLGIMVTVTNLTVSVLQPLFGYIVDKRGAGWMLAFNIGWTAILMSSVGFVQNYYFIMLLATLAGMGASFYHPLGSSYIDLLAKHNKSTAMSLYVTGGSIGYALTPLISVPLIKSFGLPSLGYLAIPGILGIAPIFSRGLNKISSVRERIDPLQNLSKINTNKGLVLLNIIVILRSWVQAVIMTFVPLLFIQRGNTIIAGGQLLSVFLVAGALGTMAGGYFSDLLSRKVFLILDFIFITFVLILFLNSSGAFAWILFALVGALVQAPIPVTVVMAQELMPSNAGVASGMIMGMGVGIGAAGAFVSGIIGDNFGIDWAVESLIILLIIGVILALFYPTERNIRNAAKQVNKNV